MGPQRFVIIGEINIGNLLSKNSSWLLRIEEVSVGTNYSVVVYSLTSKVRILSCITYSVRLLKGPLLL